MNKLVALLGFVAFAISSVASEKDKGWQNLFNGKDLKGWKQLNGQAKYEVINGEIVGTTVMNTPNSFLVTEKNYTDFIFEVDLLVESDMNSGIQFRSESKPEYNNGRVHGYQCEVDPSARAWSGGIYDEARRGWLYTLELNPAAKPAFKLGAWNHYRIECIGNSIRTWLNGVPAAWVIDDMTPAGFIALQVHSIGNNKEKEGKKIRWKNIRIKTKNLKPAPFDDIYVANFVANQLSDPEKKQGFRLLFDGETSNGWRSVQADQFPAQGWVIRDGNLTVLSKDELAGKRGGDIVTVDKFKAFELKFDFNLSEGANSGLKYFVGNGGATVGLEYQILDDEKHPDAKNGIEGNRKLGSLYDLIPAEKEGRFVNKPGQWNQGRIVVYPDNRVEHWLNGRKILEFERGGEAFRAAVAKSKFSKINDFAMMQETPILLQDHNDRVQFRSIKIREIK